MKDAIADHLDHLIGFGNRFIGSPGNAAAADYIHQAFTQAGLHVRRISFECPAWESDEAYVSVAGQRFNALANTYSPACDVTAPALLLRSLTELQQADATGHILVLCGELTREPLASYAEHAVYLPEFDRAVALLLRQKQPLGIVTICLAPGYLRPVIEDRRLDIPSVTVSAEDGLRILAALDESITLHISSRHSTGQTAHVIGTTTEMQAADQRRVIVCAHYDTNRNTHGAWDNGAGVATILGLASNHAANPLPVPVEFIAFSAEEYSVADTYDEPYLHEYGLSIPPFVWGKEIAAPYHASGLDNVIAVINLDGIGQALTANTVATMACSDVMKALVDEVRRPFPGLVSVDGWPASNHYGFYSNGIPSVALGSTEMKNMLHHPRDTAEWLSLNQMNEAAQFAKTLITRLADQSPAWSRMLRE